MSTAVAILTIVAVGCLIVSGASVHRSASIPDDKDSVLGLAIMSGAGSLLFACAAALAWLVG